MNEGRHFIVGLLLPSWLGVWQRSQDWTSIAGAELSQHNRTWIIAYCSFLGDVQHGQ